MSSSDTVKQVQAVPVVFGLRCCMCCTQPADDIAGRPTNFDMQPAQRSASVLDAGGPSPAGLGRIHSAVLDAAGTSAAVAVLDTEAASRVPEALAAWGPKASSQKRNC